jgi:hypothetical protein
MSSLNPVETVSSSLIGAEGNASIANNVYIAAPADMSQSAYAAIAATNTSNLYATSAKFSSLSNILPSLQVYSQLGQIRSPNLFPSTHIMPAQYQLSENSFRSNVSSRSTDSLHILDIPPISDWILHFQRNINGWDFQKDPVTADEVFIKLRCLIVLAR